MNAKTLIRPRRLPPAATIGVAALSGRVDPARLDAGLAYLRGRGYRIVEASNLRSERGDFAGDDRERARGYLDLVEDPGVHAVFFARGGWGAARALAFLDARRIAARPKIHMGGSDLTTLFAFLGREGLVCFHGPMVAVDFARDPVDPETDRWWEPVLRGEARPVASLKREQILRPGRGVGPLVGGCLSLLAAAEGTPEHVDTTGRILFWEDVGEEAYRLDRMLTQLSRAGRLNAPAGVIIGTLNAMTRHGRADEGAVAEVLADHFGSAPYPVIRDWPAGHGLRNRAMPLGVPVELDADRGRIVFGEGGVW
jgi:muramoyltetrapeptide carboxypeptidase